MSEREKDRKNGMDAAKLKGAQEPLGANGQPLRQKKHSECDEWGWWEDRTLAEKILIGIGFGLLAIGLAFLFGWVVMLLWNWLMPEIFGLKRVTYWQAWGLLILCCILFKDFGSGHGSGRSDRKRRRHLRRYLREEQAATVEQAAE